jgi:hypothetical protein
MTKNAAGHLTVPLSQGEQIVLVQHRQPLSRGLGFAIGSVAVPQLSEPATRTNLSLLYPEQWVPLYESFASHAKLWSPEASDVILFIVIALWLERLLAWLAMPATRRFVIAFLAALASTLVSTFLAIVILACAALTIAWLITLSLRARIGYAVGLAIAAILVFGVFVTRQAGDRSYESVSSVGRGDVDAMARQNANAKIPQPATLAYQGLPAKFTLPGGARSSYFSQELLRADRPQRALVVAVSVAIVKWIGVLIALLAIAMLWRERRALADAIRTRLARPQPEAVPA